MAHDVLGNQDRKSYCSQIERGTRKLSDLTIRKFADRLDLPDTVVNPLLGLPVPDTDEVAPEDSAAQDLSQEVEDLRTQLKLSESLAVALAYKYAEGNPTDLDGALAGLEDALQVAAKERDKGALSSNLGEAVDDILQRVDEMNEAGDIDAADAALEDDLERRRAEHERRNAEHSRLLQKAIAQTQMTRNAAKLADRTLELVALDASSPEDQFHCLRALQRERYKEGLRRGTPFALAAAIGLAKKCVSIAPSQYLAAMAQNDLTITLQSQGIRTGGAEGAGLLAEG